MRRADGRGGGARHLPSRPVRTHRSHPTGNAGSATGSASSKPFVGEILGLAIDYHGSAPGTTDITIEGATTGLDLYAKANSVTDTFVVPVLYSVDNARSALASDVTSRRYCVGEAVKVTLVQCDALATAVSVRVFYDPDIQAETIAVTTTGSAGSASGSKTGLITHGGSSAWPSTTTGARRGPRTSKSNPALSGVNFYAKSNSVTDAYVAPGVFAVTAAEGSLASNVTPERYVIGSPVKVLARPVRRHHGCREGDGIQPPVGGPGDDEPTSLRSISGLYALARAGQVFHAVTAASGVAPGTAIGTTAAFTLYNPVGSGVNMVVLQGLMSYVSGTLGAGMVEWVANVNPAAAAVTGTAIVPVNALLGGAASKHARSRQRLCRPARRQFGRSVRCRHRWPQRRSRRGRSWTMSSAPSS